MSEVPASKREWRGPESGILLDSDDNQFDLTEHLKNGRKEIGGKFYSNSFDPSLALVLKEILAELKKINIQLSLITDEEIQ